MLGLLLLAVFIAGCAPMKASTSASGSLAIGLEEDQKRAAESSSTWFQRGAQFGSIAHLYCVGGSASERRLMLEAASQYAAPARITVTCPE